MMLTSKLQSFLEVAQAKRTTGVPNSDEFVVRKLTEDLAERMAFLREIESDDGAAEMKTELESEIASISRALTAYPQQATA